MITLIVFANLRKVHLSLLRNCHSNSEITQYKISLRNMAVSLIENNPVDSNIPLVEVLKLASYKLINLFQTQ